MRNILEVDERFLVVLQKRSGQPMSVVLATWVIRPENRLLNDFDGRYMVTAQVRWGLAKRCQTQ